MNKYNDINELINLLEIKKDKVIEDAKKERLECIARVDALRIGAKTFEDEVILKYIELRNIAGTVNHFKSLGVKSKSGRVYSPTDVSSLIKEACSEVNEVLLRIATDILNGNKDALKKRSRYL